MNKHSHPPLVRTPDVMRPLVECGGRGRLAVVTRVGIVCRWCLQEARGRRTS